MTATLSVVVPVLNEQDNVDLLLDEILTATADLPLKEIIFINDGSTDGTLRVLQGAKTRVPQLRVINHAQRCGQSAAIATGVCFAMGDAIVTLDGDGQNDPRDIPTLYTLYATQTRPAIVLGQRRKRNDDALKRLSSKYANKIRQALLKDGVRDSGCGIKIFPRAAFLQAPYFNHMHRFMGAIMKREGLIVVLCDVNHRPRERGSSKYGFWNRAWVGLVDLFGVWWLLRRGPATNVTKTEV
jgi:dolichol-phosphate mannosyltransferase